MINGSELELPRIVARVIDIDFSGLGIKISQRALAALAVLANEGSVLNKEMLMAGISHRYQRRMLDQAIAVITSVCP